MREKERSWAERKKQKMKFEILKPGYANIFNIFWFSAASGACQQKS